jgi:hypothetical protein
MLDGERDRAMNGSGELYPYNVPRALLTKPGVPHRRPHGLRLIGSARLSSTTAHERRGNRAEEAGRVHAGKLQRGGPWRGRSPPFQNARLGERLETATELATGNGHGRSSAMFACTAIAVRLLARASSLYELFGGGAEDRVSTSGRALAATVRALGSVDLARLWSDAESDGMDAPI